MLKVIRIHRQFFTKFVREYVYNGGTTTVPKIGAIEAHMDKRNLLNQLQTLRLRLHDLAEARGSLTHPDVLALSEEADRLIIVLQQLQREDPGVSGESKPTTRL